MDINRKWAMPNKHTFQIEPIRRLVIKYMQDGKGWIDPFCGHFSWAQHKNDINPDVPRSSTMPALEYCKSFDRKFNGMIFDPPYSPRQIKECYDNAGLDVHQKDTQSSFYSNVKNVMAPKIETGGYVLCFGWNSMGFGKNRGFEMKEILLVAHGGAKNDTICTVEQKTQSELFLL